MPPTVKRREPSTVECRELLLIDADAGSANFTLVTPPVRLCRSPRARPPIVCPLAAGAVRLENVLEAYEACNLIDALESSRDFAPRQRDQNMRLSDVVVWVTPPELTKELFRRFEPLLPRLVSNGFAPPGVSRLPVALNARMRCYRYGRGQEFKPHHDMQQSGVKMVGGTLTEDGSLRSWFTVLIYLNSGGVDFQGGATALYDRGEDQHPPLRIVPRCGEALVFPHGEHPDSILHAGEAVESGTKYVIRTEFLYRYAPSDSAAAA